MLTKYEQTKHDNEKKIVYNILFCKIPMDDIKI